MNKISVKGKSFIDNDGRERIFNGMNVVYKGIEADENGVIHYKTALNEEAAAMMESKGMNIVRLGVTWAAVEPEMCKYNNVYLQEVKDTLKICEKHGIYAFIDFHQDLYSPFCVTNADGAPKWAVAKKVKPRKTRIIWAESYFIKSPVQKGFDGFWENTEVKGRGVQDRFCDMLKYVVKYFSDCKNIMAYDVLNEPYPGTPGVKVFNTLVLNGAMTLLTSKRVDRKKMINDAVSGRIMDMLSVADDHVVYHGIIDEAEKIISKFDRGYYYEFLKKCCETIRSVDESVIVFMENSYFSNLGIPFGCPNVTYDDGTVEKNLAFAPHGYDLTVDTPLTNVASPHRVDFIFNEHERKQEKSGLPVLVGEWGGMVAGAEEYPALEHLLDKFDRNKWSQTYWHYSGDFVKGNSKILDILSRPYPMAVSGEIKYYGYDRKSKTFTLSYASDGSTKAHTLIYLPSKPKSIISTKKYTLKQQRDGYILSVYAGKGASIVKVEL